MLKLTLTEKNITRSIDLLIKSSIHFYHSLLFLTLVLIKYPDFYTDVTKEKIDSYKLSSKISAIIIAYHLYDQSIFNIIYEYFKRIDFNIIYEY